MWPPPPGGAPRSSATSTCPRRPAGQRGRPVPGGRGPRALPQADLPNYGVFDEQRWFAPGNGPPALFEVAGVPVGITICEDMWFPGGPMAEQAAAGARLLVNLNASPYSRGRREERLAVLGERAAETGCPIVYVNQVGGQDELVFDGASLVVDPRGDVVASAGQFAEEVLVADRRRGRPGLTGHGRRDAVVAVTVVQPGRGAPAGAPDRRRARPGGRGLRGAGARHPRLPGQERVHRRGDRAVGRDRLVPGGGRRRRRPGPDARARGGHAVALLERGLGVRRGRPGRQPRHRLAAAPPSRGPTGPSPPRWPRCSGANRPG